jgi:hypothetical protein
MKTESGMSVAVYRGRSGEGVDHYWRRQHGGGRHHAELGRQEQPVAAERRGGQRYGHRRDHRAQRDSATPTIARTMRYIAMRVSGNRSDGATDGLVDWVGEPRSFTPWIAQG